MNIKMTGLMTGAAFLMGTVAHAGGYVVPIIEAVPAVTASTGTGPSPWLAAIPLLIAGFLISRDNGNVPPPGDYGGPCFSEGTLIETVNGLKRVEKINVGDMVVTSSGPQEVLSVESWLPTEYKDRPAIYNGVSMSQNHAVLHEGEYVPAGMATNERGIIDGNLYYHILVRNHAWLVVLSTDGRTAIFAESMLLTADIRPLCDRFRDVVELHAANPVFKQMPVTI